MGYRRKAKGFGMMLGVLLVAMVLVGLGIGGVYLVTQQSTTDTETFIQGAVADTFCSDNPSVDGSWKATDKLTATAGSVNVSYYLVDKTASTVSQITVTSNGLTFVSSTNSFICGHEYDIYTQTNNDDDVGVLVKSLSSSDTKQDPVVISSSVPQHRNVRMRLKNENAGLLMNVSAGTDVTQYKNVSSFLNFTSTTTNFTATTIGAGDQITFTAEVKTSEVDAQCGIDSYLALDYVGDSDPNDWQEPNVAVNGNSLSNVKGTLSSNDQLGLSRYEAVYKLPHAIGESESDQKVSIQLVTGSGVNADYDLVGRWLCSGVYVNDKSPDELLVGALFREDASRTEIATATAMTWQIAFD